MLQSGVDRLTVLDREVFRSSVKQHREHVGEAIGREHARLQRRAGQLRQASFVSGWRMPALVCQHSERVIQPEPNRGSLAESLCASSEDTTHNIQHFVSFYFLCVLKSAKGSRPLRNHCRHVFPRPVRTATHTHTLLCHTWRCHGVKC